MSQPAMSQPAAPSEVILKEISDNLLVATTTVKEAAEMAKEAAEVANAAAEKAVDASTKAASATADDTGTATLVKSPPPADKKTISDALQKEIENVRKQKEEAIEKAKKEAAEISNGSE